MQRAYASVLACLLLAAAVVLVSPWRAVDPDTLANLAVGRFIVQHGSVPATDPFTFTDPIRAYSNPEWLADVLWYGVHRVAGEAGLVAFKLLLVSLAWILAWSLSARGSTSLRTVSLLMLLALLPACASRFIERNELHACWMVPLYAIGLARIGRDRRWGGILLLLGALWANLHSSFVVGWLLVGTALLDRLLAQDKTRHEIRILLTVLLLHPLLGLLSPRGLHNFDQLIDHVRGAPVYARIVNEWMPTSDASSGLAGELAIHLLPVLGLLSFLPRGNRRKFGGLVLIASSLVLTQRAPRFFPLAVLMSVPTLSANLALWLDQRSPRTRRIGNMASLAAVLLLLVPATVEILTERGRPAIFDRTSARDRLARFLAQNAPAGSKLLNTYNTGPWLLWHASPRVQIAIDPRNNLGAENLRRYHEEVWVDRHAFQQELRNFSAGLAMLDLYGDQRTGPSRFLEEASDWRLVYLDGRYALFARDTENNRDLIQDHGYRLIRARLSFEYLLAPSQTADTEESESDRRKSVDLGADLLQLRAQGPSLSTALAGYAELCRDGDPPPRLRVVSPADGARRGARHLQEAMAHLPPSAHLLGYLATAYERYGNREGRAQVMAMANEIFPNNAFLLALQSEIERHQGHAQNADAVLAHGAAHGARHLLAEPDLPILLSNQPLTIAGWPGAY